MINYFLAQQHMFNSCHSVAMASIARDRKAHGREVVGQLIVPIRSAEWDNFPKDWYAQQEAKARASGDYDANEIKRVIK